MSGLSFDAACAHLRSTMPDAEFYTFERHGDVDKYGLPTGEQAAMVTCYEPRLNNAVREIGGWTFLIDNRFISHTVHKVAMMWLMHKGGIQFGEPELMRAMRHCFKRFYAESLVALATPPIGRALLLESIIFERRFVEELLRHGSAETNPEAISFNSTSCQVVNQGTLICQRHEIAHVLLSRTDRNVVEHAADLADGIFVPLIRNLVETGKSKLAEEVFCDAFAMNSIIRTKEELSGGGFFGKHGYDLLHLDDVRGAYFCYTIIMQLSQIWLRAFQDARNDWDVADRGAADFDYSQFPLEAQARERSSFVSTLVDTYIRKKGGDIHQRDASFFFNPRCDQLVAQASRDVHRLSEVDTLSIVSEPDREIARFLASTMWLSASTSQFLIAFSRQREFEGWRHTDEMNEAEPGSATEVTDTVISEEPHIRTRWARNSFWKAIESIYADYTKIFDAIIDDILCGGVPEDGTEARLETYKTNACAQIDNFGQDDPAYAEIITNAGSEAHRNRFKIKILELHVILLTLWERITYKNTNEAFPLSVKERLSYLEDYAARNQGVNVASFASILIPELEVDR